MSFGGVEAEGFTVQDDFRILAASPPHPDGVVLVTITTPDGSSTPCDPTGPEQAQFRYAEPVGGAWSRAGLLGNARTNHTATLLADGRVLVAGGVDGSNGPSRSAELYDPATRVWRATGELNSPLSGHTATRLADGRVLVAGGDGLDADGNTVNGVGTAEVYDPITGSWTPTANNLTTGRRSATATLLADGKVLVVGGFGGSNPVIGSSELYDPKTNTWSSCSPLATPSADCPGDLIVPRRTHSATVLHDGKVLVAAGKDGARQTIASTELYDPSTGTWSSCSDAAAGANCPGPLSNRRFGNKSVTLNDGKALVIAGQAFDGGRIGSVEEYTPATGRWAPTGSLGGPRTSHQSTLLADGRVLVSGGIGPDSQGTPEASSEIYDPAARSWSFTGFQIVPRHEQTATLLQNGQVLAVGGNGTGNRIRLTERFTPASPVSTPDPGTGSPPSPVSTPGPGTGSPPSPVSPASTPDPGAGSPPSGSTPVPTVPTAPATPPGAARDTTRPVVSGLGVFPGRFTLGSLLPRLAHAARVGTTIRFSLSERAAVSLSFERRHSGRLVGRACRGATRALRSRPLCRRFVTVLPSVRFARGRAGANRVRFQGRLSGTRMLRPGHYRVTVRATDPAGNRSRPKRVLLTASP